MESTAPMDYVDLTEELVLPSESTPSRESCTTDSGKNSTGKVQEEEAKIDKGEDRNEKKNDPKDENDDQANPSVWRHAVTMLRDISTASALILHVCAILTPWWVKREDSDQGMLMVVTLGENNAGNIWNLAILATEVYAVIILYTFLIVMMVLCTTKLVRKCGMKTAFNWILAIVRLLISGSKIAGLILFSLWFDNADFEDTARKSHSFHLAAVAMMLSILATGVSFLKLLKQI